MSRQSILIIEDDDDIAELVRYNLAKEGFAVEVAGTGEEGLKKLRQELPAIILLDLMLPGIDGFEVCQTVRKQNSSAHVPIIMMTAKGEESDVVAGLELGADDYIVKPFSPRLLVARVRAVLRRKSREVSDEQTPISVRGISIHPGRHEVRINQKSVDLTHLEFRVLYFLASRPGWVYTRYQIVNEIRGEEYPVTDRAVDVMIVGLRRKLGVAGELIETVRGVGYKFKE